MFCHTLHRYYHSKQYLKHVVVLQEDSPRFVASTAVASQAAEPQLGTAPEDEDAAHIVWLEHINGGNNRSCPPSGNPMTEHAVMQHMNRMHLANVNTAARAFLQNSFHGCRWHLPTLLSWPDHHNSTLGTCKQCNTSSGLQLPCLLMT